MNVSNGLSIKNDLKGKLVLIDFWTYCCINCMHIMPILNQLEAKYKQVNLIFKKKIIKSHGLNLPYNMTILTICSTIVYYK